MPDFAKIRIQVPAGCNRKKLDVNALDARTRELALKTFIFIDGKQLLCGGFEVDSTTYTKPVLRITVTQECFEIVESKDPQEPDTSIL